MRRTASILALSIALVVGYLSPVGAQDDQESQAGEDLAMLKAEALAEANAELDKLTEQLSKVCSEPGFRGFLRSEIAKSKNRENILELGAFLERGMKSKGKMPLGLEKLHKDTKAFEKKIADSGIPLMNGFDLYFPVQEHRRKWSGNADLFVAYSPYGDEESIDTYIAYSVKTGERYALEEANLPATPVLFIVPEEHWSHEVPVAPQTDLSPPPEPRDGGMDEPLKIDQGENTQNSDLQISWLRILTDHESSGRGYPEIIAYYADACGYSKHDSPINRARIMEPTEFFLWVETTWYSGEKKVRLIGPSSTDIATWDRSKIDLSFVNKTNYWYYLEDWMRYPINSCCSNEGVFVLYEYDGDGLWDYYFTYIYSRSVKVGFMKMPDDDMFGRVPLYKSHVSYGQWRYTGHPEYSIFWKKNRY